MRNNNQIEPQGFDVDELFQFTMAKNWMEVLRICKSHPSDACKAKLTKSEETVLHIAVSSYHVRERGANALADIIRQLVKSLPVGQAVEILKAENKKGDTALHLAAALGSVTICECIATKDRELIMIRNQKGETPMFLAAHHGHMEAFRWLHELYNWNAREPDYSLCRRNDGDTILHSAISGEYFALADLITIKYDRLVNSVNQEGISPLHILARKPNVFESSSNLRLCDRMIYRCVYVPEVKSHQSRRGDWRSIEKTEEHYPENYQTCVNFIRLLSTAFRIIAPLGKGQDQGQGQGPGLVDQGKNGRSLTDTADPEEGKMEASRGEDSDSRQPGSTEDREIPIEGNQGKELNDENTFPPNYATCIQLFKFAINLALIIFGIGIWKISKMREKKQRHNRAVRMMDKLIEKESRYKYSHDGQNPINAAERMYAERIDIPKAAPEAPDTPSSSKDNIPASKSKDEKNKIESKPEANPKDAKETSILLAAKMGISEMVEKILKTFPVAIQDLDANGKNALLLTVENRQIKVFDLLMTMKLPEFVLYQIDNEGNSAMHLAAKFQEHKPWRIPGTALQMQWELKWFKHVKTSMPPQCFIQYNKKYETAREIFTKTHEKLAKDGSEWMLKTSESCSVVAALIAAVAFATASSIPGGVNQDSGHPVLEREPIFRVFSVASIVALCFSVTALVFFLAILTSRCEQRDFKRSLPRKLLIGLSSLFTSISAILVSFCAGDFFVLQDQVHRGAFPIYAVACLPITFFAFAQLPLYFDLLWSIIRKVPVRCYKLYYN
ncbi:uncharacterized protein LOC113764496 isoform X2 [Coffea eugenioides]|uniref:uncharacterized protein LOC113764496 isoform X2 n=1 Tax=Coffea eugenioides TaxID=49369 RepID=UPI000F60B6E9|nr:uncharacterized protein LOC113764496 isoform X2 [Coffea eugenioides]